MKGTRRVNVSVVIVNYKTPKLVKDCVESVVKQTKGVSYEVIVVDNASSDGSLAAIRNLQHSTSNLKLIENRENLGFAGGNNLGIKQAEGDYVLLLNSDTILWEDAISFVVAFMKKHPKVGVASCALVNPDGSLQATGGYFPTLGRVFAWALFVDDLPLVGGLLGSYHPHTPKFFTKSRFYTKKRQMDWVTGAFFMIRKEVIEGLGGLDEEFFMYVEEVEYCFRVKQAGWQVYYLPEARVVHLGGASTVGSAGQVMGEFNGLKLFYGKHFPGWREEGLKVALGVAAGLRWVVFGVMMGKKEKGEAYAKALANI